VVVRSQEDLQGTASISAGWHWKRRAPCTGTRGRTHLYAVLVSLLARCNRAGCGCGRA
jgi:hypothetical protein